MQEKHLIQNNLSYFIKLKKKKNFQQTRKKSDFFKLKREINKNPTVKSLFNGETLEYLSKLGTSSCQHVCSMYSGQCSKTHKVSERHKGWGGRNKFTIFILV